MTQPISCPRRLPSRRSFAQLLCTGAVGLVTACDTEELDGLPRYLLPAGDLAEGEPWNFTYPSDNDPAFVVKLGRPAADGVGPDGDIVAFHRACPHMGCPIGPVDAERSHLGPCPCHQSTFDLRRNGLQVFGRATQDLVQVRLELSGDGRLLAIGLRGVPYGLPPVAGAGQ